VFGSFFVSTFIGKFIYCTLRPVWKIAGLYGNYWNVTGLSDWNEYLYKCHFEKVCHLSYLGIGDGLVVNVPH
jgi:hypothetical protein